MKITISNLCNFVIALQIKSRLKAFMTSMNKVRGSTEIKGLLCETYLDKILMDFEVSPDDFNDLMTFLKEEK